MLRNIILYIILKFVPVYNIVDDDLRMELCDKALRFIIHNKICFDCVCLSVKWTPSSWKWRLVTFVIHNRHNIILDSYGIVMKFNLSVKMVRHSVFANEVRLHVRRGQGLYGRHNKNILRPSPLACLWRKIIKDWWKTHSSPTKL